MYNRILVSRYFVNHYRNSVEERCNFENLLHAKWSNFDNTQKIHQIFRDIGLRGNNNLRKMLLIFFFKQRSSKLKKGYSQDLVKQTVV